MAQSVRWSSTKGKSSPKMILNGVWNLHGFHLIDVRRKGSKFNAGHYISHILSPWPEILAPCQDDPKTHLVIDNDNARSHCVKTALLFLDHNSLRRAPHPPDSPDLAPQTSGCSDTWKECFRTVCSTTLMHLMNSCRRSRKFWGESIVGLWTWYFKNGWSDCKTVLMEMVPMLNNVETERSNSFFETVDLKMLRFDGTPCNWCSERYLPRMSPDRWLALSMNSWTDAYTPNPSKIIWTGLLHRFSF
jgi:hypothetical protein